LSSALHAWYTFFRDLSLTRCSSGTGLGETINADERRVRGSFQLRPRTCPAMTPS
jgi:hypothetical protein